MAGFVTEQNMVQAPTYPSTHLLCVLQENLFPKETQNI